MSEHITRCSFDTAFDSHLAHVVAELRKPRVQVHDQRVGDGDEEARREVAGVEVLEGSTVDACRCEQRAWRGVILVVSGQGVKPPAALPRNVLVGQPAACNFPQMRRLCL